MLRKTANVENIFSLDRPSVQRQNFSRYFEGGRRVTCGKTSYESFLLNISYIEKGFKNIYLLKMELFIHQCSKLTNYKILEKILMVFKIFLKSSPLIGG